MKNKKVIKSRYVKGLRILHSAIQTANNIIPLDIEITFELEKITQKIETKILGELP